MILVRHQLTPHLLCNDCFIAFKATIPQILLLLILIRNTCIEMQPHMHPITPSHRLHFQTWRLSRPMRQT